MGLKLKNGQKVQYLHEDDWGRKLFKLQNKQVVVLVDKRLHTLCGDEPDCPLKEEYQLDVTILTKREYEKIHPDHRGVFEDLQGMSPELKGARTMLLPNNGGLGFEGIHFLIDW